MPKTTTIYSHNEQKEGKKSPNLTHHSKRGKQEAKKFANHKGYYMFDLTRNPPDTGTGKWFFDLQPHQGTVPMGKPTAPLNRRLVTQNC
jgi:hypothetical protein